MLSPLQKPFCAIWKLGRGEKKSSTTHTLFLHSFGTPVGASAEERGQNVISPMQSLTWSVRGGVSDIWFLSSLLAAILRLVTLQLLTVSGWYIMTSLQCRRIFGK